jgi:hypothetical protein
VNDLRNVLTVAASVLLLASGTVVVAISGRATGAGAGVALAAWISQTAFWLGIVAAAGALATFIVQIAQAQSLSSRERG